MVLLAAVLRPPTVGDLFNFRFCFDLCGMHASVAPRTDPFCSLPAPRPLPPLFNCWRFPLLLFSLLSPRMPFLLLLLNNFILLLWGHETSDGVRAAGTLRRWLRILGGAHDRVDRGRRHASGKEGHRTMLKYCRFIRECRPCDLRTHPPRIIAIEAERGRGGMRPRELELVCAWYRCIVERCTARSLSSFSPGLLGRGGVSP